MILLGALTLMGAVHLATQHVTMTAQGSLSGIRMDGYTSYVGIPYASVKSTFGRFKQAGAAPSWQGIREPRAPRCSLRSEVADCLQLDVHVPTSGASLPVLAWLSGGAADYRPDSLVQREVIVVIVRHRLGPLGFLCSKKYNIPGNSGLKDAVQALRWIRDNIVAFRGNPHQVVLGGQGFGAAMVEALVISPTAEGLFHGAIIQSGSVLAPWAFNFDAEERADHLGMKLNNSDITKAATMNIATKGEEIEMPYLPFGLCIEGAYKGEERILFEPPYTSLSNRKTSPIPMIIGYNSNEGYIFTRTLKASKVLRKMRNDMRFLIPMELQSDANALSAITAEVREVYFRNNITVEAVLNYHSDAYFTSHIHKSVHLHSPWTSVYYYRFSYSGSAGVEAEANIPKWGAAHSDELAYLFPAGNNFTDDVGIVVGHFIELWTNFVKYLNPNSMRGDRAAWEAVEPGRPRLLDIGVDADMRDFPLAEEARLWGELYDNYYRGDDTRGGA